jgi:hypothetical protein
MKKSKESQNKMVVGIAWYRPEQWQRVRDISADADALQDSYEAWLQLAEGELKKLQSSGLRVEKVDIDSEQLILWCNEQGVEVSAQARARYAAEKLSELDGGQS